MARNDTRFVNVKATVSYIALLYIVSVTIFTPNTRKKKVTVLQLSTNYRLELVFSSNGKQNSKELVMKIELAEIFP